MTKQSRLERLTQVQLIQKIIYLESELALNRTDREKKNRRFREQIIELKQDKDRLKGEIQKLLHELETYDQERDELINEYNQLLLKKADYENQITLLQEKSDTSITLNKLENYEKENEWLIQMVDELKKEVEVQKEKESKLFEENRNLESEMEGLRKYLSELEDEYAEGQQITVFLKEKIEQQTIDIKKTLAEKEHIYKEKEELLSSMEKLKNQLQQNDGILENFIAREYSISNEIIQLEKNISMSEKIISEMQIQNDSLKQELEKKSTDLSEAAKQHEKLSQEINQFSQKLAELEHRNKSSQERIKQLELEKEEALKTNSHLKTELLNERKQLKESKSEMANHLENDKIEINRLEEENKQHKKEKMELLNKITHLEEENLSFHERFLKLTELREHDEKRMDKISNNLNEVFQETKQLVRMTSSLKHQLEAKVLVLNQIKEEKKILEAELTQFKNDYEMSEQRNKELENKIDQLGTELHNAKQSLSLLQQAEAEKLQISKELEAKIEEFILSTENYQREKESYLDELEQVQNQIKKYKESANRFEVEKTEWSTQINELKMELEQTRKDLEKKEEIEQKSNKLAEELQTKEMEIDKIRKENELAQLQKMNQFNLEIKMKQEFLEKSELKREKLEKQINEMKAQFNVLKSSLEEKENFIKQFISLPLFQSGSGSPVNVEKNQQKFSKPLGQQIQERPIQHQVHQSLDWFQQIKAQQQYTYQQTQAQTKSSNPAAMDFFTLRNKTTQPIILPNQQNQK